MQLCGKCGNYNSDESIFCGHCANRLNNNCPACGYKNLWEQKFCGNCGKQLQATAELTAGPSIQEPRPASVPVGETRTETAKEPAMTVQDITMTSQARLEPPSVGPAPELTAYALASVEFANWDQVLAASPEPQRMEQFRQRCQMFVEERMQAAGGYINASKKNILFVAFKREESLETSLWRAIETALSLLGEDFRYPQGSLKLRIGLDIEHAQARNPLTSTLERSVGLPGTLTISEAAREYVQGRYALETVGPVPMGNRSMTFYRVVQPGEALSPSAGAVIPSAASVQEQVKTNGALSTPLAPAPIPSAEPSSAAIETPAEITPQVTIEAETPMMAPPPERPTEAYPAPAPAAAEMPEAEQADRSPALELPRYEQPIWAEFNAPRRANVNYESAIEALSAELDAFLSQAGSGKGRLMSVCAADGLGKSSIVHMVRSKVDPDNQRAIWMGGHNYRCFHHRQLPLYYWIELVQNLLSLVFEGQPSRDVREQLGKFLGFIYDGEVPVDEMEFLSDLLSVNPPLPLSVESRANLGRMQAFFLHFFQTLASKRPLIVVLEDLVFADPATLDLLVGLLENGLLEAPVYFVMTQGRDYYATGRFAELLQKVPYKELVISELTDPEAERFLDEGPLGGQLHTYPTQLIDLIVRSSKGLPMYLEEIMRLLHLQEAVTVHPETYKFVINREFDFSNLAMADNLPDLLRLRMGYLNEQTQYVLFLASILGEKFAVNLLMALAQMEEDEFNEALTTLFNHGFLLPDAVNTGRFRHGLIWETVYADIDPSLRLQMHQLVSETLENDFNRGVTVNPLLVAYHSECGALPNRALNFWNLAGIYAGQVGSLVGMNMAMFRALDLLRETAQQPLHTQELVLRIVESLGIFNLEEDPDLASALLEWVFHYRKPEGDVAKLIEPLGYLASAYENQGDFSKALLSLEKTLEFIDPKAYPLEAASLQMNRMEYLYTLGRLQQARELMEAVIEPVAQSRGMAQGGANFLDSLLQARLLKGQIMLAQCDNAAMPLLEETFQQAKERQLEGLGIALQLTKSQLLLRNGQYEAVNREADSLLSAIESMEDSDWFLAQWGLLAIMYHCELEDWNSASQLVLTVISKSEGVRDYLTWVIAQAYAGYISGKLGKIKEARQLIEQAIGLSSQYRFASAALLGWRFLADFELSCGNHEVAYEIATKALDIANKPDIRNGYEALMLTLVSARALMAQGKAKEAGKLLEPAWPMAAKAKWQPLVAACAFEIGQLYKLLAQNVPSDLSRKHLTRSVEFFLKAKGIWLELRHMGNVKKVDAAIPKL
ncbi:MAG: Adenylate cyclase [Vampirovibrio sp.]|jgi:tetratricopeptide (TPR) repeat protein|nr:Adenylate cyclase [Vampirovibrio sp.]